MSYMTEKYGTDGPVSAVSDARAEHGYARIEGTVHTLVAAYAVVARVIEPVIGWLDRSQRARKTAHVLRGLSDHQLADIGLARDEISLVSRDCAAERVGSRNT